MNKPWWDMNGLFKAATLVVTLNNSLGPSNYLFSEDGLISTWCGDGKVLVVEQFRDGRVEWSYTDGSGELTGDLSESGKAGLDSVIADYLEGSCR